MKTDILNAIEDYEGKAVQGGQLAKERATALDYYLGAPFGNEVEGRSQVVSRDVADTIEWIKPSLMRIFTSGDEIIQFQPKGPEDIASSQQETDYINYVLTQKNNWFSTMYVWGTDALMQKNGYVKAYWEERDDHVKESYQGLTDDQFALIAQDQEVEILEHMEVQSEYGMLHNVTVRKKKNYGCVKYCNLPPERVLVNSLHPNVDLSDAMFVEHFEEKTLSSLRAEGFDVPDDIGDDAVPTDDEETQARNLYNESITYDADTNDPASRLVVVRECWLRFDEDGDGIAELRHVIVVGQTILLNEETDIVPIAAITPTIMPHRHIGRSIADAIADLQLIKSTILRGYLDNIYLSNNGRYGIDKDRVNLDDMLTSRPGGVVRTEGPPQQAIMPLVHQVNLGQTLQGLEYLDSVKETRTGVTRYNQGLDANSLNKTATGITQIMTAAQARIELIARVFAETGVKVLFNIIHALTLKHARQAEIVRLRNQWVVVDPRQWQKRADMVISVGLGTGNKEQMMQQLFAIYQSQKEMLPLGIAQPKNIYHTLTKFTEAAGFKDSAAFYNDPGDKPFQPPPDPKVAEAQQKAQLEAASLQQRAQRDQQELILKAKTTEGELALKKYEIDLTANVKREAEAEKAEASRNQRVNVHVEGEEELQKMGQMVMQIAESNNQAISQALQQLSQAATMLVEAAKSMTGEREVIAIRGKDGKIAGARSRPAGDLH